MYFDSKAWKIFLASVLFLIATAVLSVLVFFNPAESPYFPPCPFFKITSLYCPGCGSLRAVHYLLHGRLLTAFDLNPLMVLFLPFIGYIFLSRFLVFITGRQLLSLEFLYSPILIWAILALILAYWILRNIPVQPFIFLAP